jgi:hypothetical protein
LLEAARDEQQCKNEVLLAESNPIDLHSGERLDLKEWSAGFKESDSDLEILIKKRSKRRDRLLNEWRRAEYVCLGAICVAMVSLVWLALRNF